MNCCNKSVCSCRPAAVDCVRICPPECTDIPCIPCVLEVEKSLLSVTRVPTQEFIDDVAANGTVPVYTQWAQLILTYEIAIINRTDKEVTNLQIHDTLAGLVLEGQVPPYLSTLEIVKAPGYIATFTPEAIAANGGSLVDPCYSTIPVCSVTKLVLRLVISAPPDTNVDIKYILNTLTINGTLCGQGKLRTVVELSDLWRTKELNILVGPVTPPPPGP